MSKLILNSKPYPLPSRFRKMGEITNDEVFQQLTQNNQQYIVQSKVSEEVLSQFILYLTDGKEPEIHIDNLFEFQQLSVEFGTKEVKDFIQKKTAKWRQIEAQLEQQGTLSNSKEQEFERRINDLEQQRTLSNSKEQEFERRINDLEQHIQNIYAEINALKNQNISNHANQAAIGANQMNQINTTIDDIQNTFTQNIETTKNEIDVKIEDIKNEISDKENQIQAQINQSNELSRKIDQLKNQMNSFQTQLSNTQSGINQTEESINSTFESVKLSIDEIKQSYVSKDIFTFNNLSNSNNFNLI